MKSVRRLLFAAWLAALCCQAGRAQTTQNQFWPELDTYATVNQKLRVSLFAKRATDGLDYNSIQIGPNLDISLKPLRKRIISNDVDINKLVVFRIGYRYLTNSTGPNESRGILQITQRFPIPWSLLASDRNRADLRSINHTFSWRYRNRLTVERTFKIKSFHFNPYVEDEVYYDSRYSTWTKNYYSVGVAMPIGKRFEAKPYFRRVHQSHSTLQNVHGVGFIVSLYF